NLQPAEQNRRSIQQLAQRHAACHDRVTRPGRRCAHPGHACYNVGGQEWGCLRDSSRSTKPRSSSHWCGQKFQEPGSIASFSRLIASRVPTRPVQTMSPLTASKRMASKTSVSFAISVIVWLSCPTERRVSAARNRVTDSLAPSRRLVDP